MTTFDKAETYFEIVEDTFRKHPQAEITLPNRAHRNDAGYDLYSPVDVTIPGANLEDDVIFKSELIWLDIKVKLPVNNCLLIDIRSGLGTKEELMITNTLPLIDPRHYYNKNNGGNIGVMIRNLSKKPYHIKAGDRIAQGVITPYGIVTGDWYDNDENPESGGFGETGI